jgi:GNAT superfamily N-acetyltransferase
MKQGEENEERSKRHCHKHTDNHLKSAFAKREHQPFSAADMQEIAISTHIGKAALPFLNEIARLRIAVFREFPYLYDGSLEYEMQYLNDYISSENSLIVLASIGSEIVGASTGIPLAEADADFREPVEAAGFDPGEVFYFGESVLLPEFRGRGLGHRFFDEREIHAAKLGLCRTGFFSVIRADDHPLKPINYRPHDTFWHKRGYTRQDVIIARFPWKQVGESQDRLHELVFWQRQLS